ncbi:MAG: hypothetical protein CVT49_12750 [candidate division Zixibacteria bacterium HGW-Zixibacteria-1]|nr:MAG: hypothetical protein CVT49_12750 [candidate division Zixibacteria bacterium HGW-Zixibacteria-1]
MDSRIRTIARVAVFAALVFVFSYFSVLIPNVNPSFFIVFAAGFIWGIWSGCGVGIIGFLLWSNLNPSGPAPFPVMISQLIGISFTAVTGVLAAKVIGMSDSRAKTAFVLSLSGLTSGLIYVVIVGVVDAYIFQPFWPRLIGGALFSLITIISNSIIFPILWPALVFLMKREKSATG